MSMCARACITQCIRVLNKEAAESLKGCFELTDWDLFFNDSDNNLNLLTDLITSYILFCEDTVTPIKQISIFPNNKKWVNKDIKICLVQKKKAFLEGDKLRVRELEKEFSRKAKLAKIDYKNKVEQKLTSGNAREAWQGLNITMGRKLKPAGVVCPEPTLAEKLNIIFTRFNGGSTTPTHPTSPPAQKT